MMKTIIIVTFPYIEHSNGIKTMHRICHTINDLGGDARLVFLSNGIRCGDATCVNPNLNTPCLREEDKHLLQTEIVVYPEVVSGNPVCASKVVRYLGNKDGLLTGQKMNAKPRDFLLAHSKVIEPKANCVLFNAELNPVFNENGAKPFYGRPMDATYTGKGFIHGKGFVHGECPTQPNMLLIERIWPKGQDQLAYLLKNIRFFYTWDAWTATNLDALMCGCIPFFLRYEPWTEEELDGSELGVIPRLDWSRKISYDSNQWLERFEQEKAALITRIGELNASWNARVKDFMEQVEGYFG